MSTTCAVFADVSNLYYCIGKRFDQRKLDYDKLRDRVASFGTIQRAFAYGSQIHDEATSFIACLKKAGFDPKYKRPRTEGATVVRKADWDVGLSMDVVRMINRVDTVIICSADPDLVELVHWVKDQGVRCVIVACGISRELKEIADQYVEIGEDLLEEVRHAARAA
jgi:uncharacterized LabA/DUF88 family protein